MPAPRPSESAEAARAAAHQAEFNEKKWVWVPDDKDGYLAAWVNKEEGDLIEVVMAAGGEVCRVFLADEAILIGINSFERFLCMLCSK